MTATPERARAIDFSDPYVKTGLCLLVGKDSGIEKLEDLDQPGRTVVVKIDTTGHLFASRNLKKAKVLVLDKETRGVLEVAQGKADAFIYDQMSTYANWRKNPETTRPLLTPFKEEAWAIGIRKGNDALREEVNRFLADFRAKGGFEELGDKWLSEQKAEFRKRGIPFYF
jgi:polar amino acid transport system substrate-binding protein